MPDKPRADHSEAPVVEAPAVVVVPEVHADPTATKEEALDAESRRKLAERVAPTTSEEQDRTTASQRVVNLIWEGTQKDIARWALGAALLVASTLAIFGRLLGTPELQLAAFVFLCGVASNVTGFYFGRTNHERSGGVGGESAGRR